MGGKSSALAADISNEPKLVPWSWLGALDTLEAVTVTTRRIQGGAVSPVIQIEASLRDSVTVIMGYGSW